MNLKIATAQDLTNPRERAIFRLLEILPGLASWLTIGIAVFLSWKAPFAVAVFILGFDLYWIIRAAYFHFHLKSGYDKMRQYQQTDWLAKIKEIKGWQEFYHLSVFTLCEEPWEVVKEAFQALVQSDYPKDKMLVVLSAEEKYRSKTELTVEKIQREFGPKFFKFLATWHPFGLPGEIPGKGSNDRWGQKQAKKEIVDSLAIPHEKVIVSFFDVDTCVLPKYFSCLAWHYLTCEDPLRTSFQPIPLFVNNIWEAPVFSRAFSFASTFWNTLSQERPEKLITFSSHAMSFKTLVEIDFKQPNVVSDDSRIFWQSFLKYDGDYRVQPLYYPVAMDANVAPTFGRTMKNIYKQQRRWAYGADEIPYVFFNFWKNKKISLGKKISYGWFLFESHWTWATSSVLIFLLGWLPSTIGGWNFSQTVLSYNLPFLTSRLMTLAMVGVIISIFLSFRLLPEKPGAVERSKYLIFVLEWLFLPLGMIFFWTLPAFDAQTRLMLGRYMGFWPTEKMRKTPESNANSNSRIFADKISD